MKTQTHIERNLVKIPVDHVNSFKSEEEFEKAMETEGHFANELPETREDIYAGIWKEAQGLKEQPAAEKAGDNSKNGGTSKSGTGKKDLVTDANASGISTTATGGGPATTGSGSGTTGTSSTTTSS